MPVSFYPTRIHTAVCELVSIALTKGGASSPSLPQLCIGPAACSVNVMMGLSFFSRLREACSLAEQRASERELMQSLPYLNRVCVNT